MDAAARSLARLLIVALLLILVPALRAQDSVIVIDPNAPAPDSTIRGGLPPEVLTELLAVFNDSGTLRLTGEVSVPPGNRLEGRISVYRGSVRVEGEVAGPLTVINGDLVIGPTGVVDGDILVAGGRMTVLPGGRHSGETRVFWDAAPVLRLPDGSLALRERRRALGELAAAHKTFQTGRIRTTLLLATNQTYNRIEGVPIIFGPAFEWKLSERTLSRLEVRGILRTAGSSSLFRRDLGYSVRNDWRFQGTHGFGFGARAYSLITGMEEHTLPRDEIGWSSFLIQRDNRDYYVAEGVGASVYGFALPSLRLDASIRHERDGSARANDPWSLFRNSDRWRPNPLIDDGHYTIAGLGLELDRRNHRDLTTSGWWVRLNYEHASSDDVAPIALPSLIRSSIPTDGYSFSRLTLDARRYTRLTPNTRINLRLWAGGWLGGDPLPIQHRLSLGGIDLLPGYRFRAFTCAAGGYSDPATPALCDRAIVLQTEFRSRLSLGLGYQYRDRDRRELDRFIGIEEADLVLFSDAGKAWLTGDGPGRVPNNRIPNLNEWKADAGVGIDAGGIGVYLTKALTDGEPVRLFVRLRRRF